MAIPFMVANLPEIFGQAFRASPVVLNSRVGISLPGCFCSVYDSGREYRLATYTGARADIRQSDCLLLSQGKCRFRAELLRGGKQPLLAPAGGDMTRIVCESAVCTVRYRFSAGGGAGFDLTADFASFESAFQP